MRLNRRGFLIGAAALMVSVPKLPRPPEPQIIGYDLSSQPDLAAFVLWPRQQGKTARLMSVWEAGKRLKPGVDYTDLGDGAFLLNRQI